MCHNFGSLHLFSKQLEQVGVAVLHITMSGVDLYCHILRLSEKTRQKKCYHPQPIKCMITQSRAILRKLRRHQACAKVR